MYEIDFLPVGDGKDSGDAIAFRFTSATTGAWVHVVIDAGFKNDGEALVEHVKTYYTTTTIDLAILTHPDGDHIGGMGEVVRGLNVKQLWLHDIGAHGGSTLPAASAVAELIDVANKKGTPVYEVWAGAQAFDGALTILGPDQPYYDALVQEQLADQTERKSFGKALLEAAQGLYQRLGDTLGVEVPFDAKYVNPRNNSSMITLLRVDGGHLLFTGDAGVPALERAWAFAEANGIASRPNLVQIPHHGSRRNASSAWLDRLLGPAPTEGRRGWAYVSVVANSDKHPSGKVVNAHMRRGYDVIATAGSTKYFFKGLPLRTGWSAVTPLAPMIEEED